MVLLRGFSLKRGVLFMEFVLLWEFFYDLGLGRIYFGLGLIFLVGIWALFWHRYMEVFVGYYVQILPWSSTIFFDIGLGDAIIS